MTQHQPPSWSQQPGPNHPTQPQAWPPRQPPRRSWWQRLNGKEKALIIGAAVLAGIFALGIIGAIAGPPPEEDSTPAAADASESVEPTGEPTPEPEPEPEPEPTTEEPPANTIPGSGVFLVGEDIQPGTYRTDGPDGFGCYWARLAGTSGELDDIIANDNLDGPGVVTISDSDVAFESNGCAEWTLAE